MKHQGFNTTAIHAGQEPDEATGAVTVPVHLATTYAQQGVNEHKGFEYSRTGNPTRQALEVSMAALEGVAHGFAFGSYDSPPTGIGILKIPYFMAVY